MLMNGPTAKKRLKIFRSKFYQTQKKRRDLRIPALFLCKKVIQNRSYDRLRPCCKETALDTDTALINFGFCSGIDFLRFNKLHFIFSGLAYGLVSRL